jgi:hypothetical protein
MTQVSEGQPAEYMSTHPSHETRIADLQKWMPEAMAIYNQVPKAPVANLPTIILPPKKGNRPPPVRGTRFR